MAHSVTLGSLRLSQLAIAAALKAPLARSAGTSGLRAGQAPATPIERRIRAGWVAVGASALGSAALELNGPLNRWGANPSLDLALIISVLIQTTFYARLLLEWNDQGKLTALYKEPFSFQVTGRLLWPVSDQDAAARGALRSGKKRQQQKARRPGHKKPRRRA